MRWLLLAGLLLAGGRASGGEPVELEVGGRIQPRWELSRADGEVTQRFLVARARLGVDGKVLDQAEFSLSVDFGGGEADLKDAYLELPLGPVKVRLGQQKKPTSRQRITSNGALQLVDRALTDDFADAGRDVGLVLHNDLARSPAGLEWAVGVVNGSGANVIPDDLEPVVVARVGLNLGGIDGYREADLEGGGLRFAAAVSYEVDLAHGEAGDRVQRFTGDAIAKLAGISVSAAVYARLEDAEAAVGAHAQAGVIVLPRRLELAARVSRIPLAPGGHDHELLGAVTWFFHGHALKVTTDVGALVSDGEPHLVARSQAQLSF